MQRRSTWNELDARVTAKRLVAARRVRWVGRERLDRVRSQFSRALRDISKLVKWIGENGWHVLFGPGLKDEYFAEGQLIHVNSSASPPVQLVTLLHECGHILINTRRPYDEERFGRGWPLADGPKSKKNDIFRVAVIDEELASWEEGRKLARKLKIAVDGKLWDRLKSGSVMTYVKWAARGGWNP